MKYAEIFEKKGISTEGRSIIEGKTFRWSGFYEYDMNHAHTLETQLNVFKKFSPALPESYRKARSVFLGNIGPELQLAVLEQMKPQLVVGDTMNYWIEKEKEKLLEVIKKCTIFLLNEGEARQLFDTTNLVTAGKRILSLGPEAAVIKKGEHGLLLFIKENIFMLPGYPLENVKDPTGAGDGFGGAFTGYLTKNGFDNNNLRKALVYGSAIASFNVEDFGINKLMRITMGDVEQRYSEFEKMIFF